MAQKSWGGQKELVSALSELSATLRRPISSTSVMKAVELAFKFQGEYKMVVYEFEKMIKRSPKDPFAVLCSIDALCRQSREKYGKEKDIFSARFALRLSDTLEHFRSLESSDQALLSRILAEWKSKDIFPLSVLQGLELKQAQGTASEPLQKEPPAAAAVKPPQGQGQQQTTKPIDPRLRRSINGNQPVEDVALAPQEGDASSHVDEAKAKLREKPEKPIIPNVCPFNSSSNCPFGSNCRFYHGEWSYQQSPAYAKLQTLAKERRDRKAAENGIAQESSHESKTPRNEINWQLFQYQPWFNEAIPEIDERDSYLSKAPYIHFPDRDVDIFEWKQRSYREYVNLATEAAQKTSVSVDDSA